MLVQARACHVANNPFVAKYYRLPSVRELKRLLVGLFFILHVSAVIWWVLSPYADFVLSRSEPASSRVERAVFQWAQSFENNVLARLLTGYIDVVGGHQYWDFFAPEPVHTHRYLSLCDDIVQNTAPTIIECLNEPLFKTYDGTLTEAVKSFNGKRSRSFRFAENLIRFDRPSFYHWLTTYWANERHSTDGPYSNHAYLVSHKFLMQPGTKILSDQHQRTDDLLWYVRRVEGQTDD